MKIYLSPTVRMKFIHYTLLIATLLLSSNVYAQISTNEPPPSFTTQLRITAKVDEEVITGLPNMNQILKEDIQDSINGMPPRFGYPLKINLNTENSGTWETLSDGSKMWRLTIYSPKALSINLLYDKFWLPDNTKFFIYNEKKTQSIGAFTSSNNKGDKGKPEKFATEIMYGDRITLEYYQPQGVNERPVISIAFVVHGYRYINISNEFTTLGLGSSLSCNINVNCWQGSPYQLQKRAVALIVVGGARWCTGSLINNTSNNMQPYFLTADHCLNGLDAVTNPNAYYWSFMWNYESPTCANPPSDPGYYTTSGATVVANHQPTDMALLRLTEDPKNLSCYAPSYTGWSRSSAGAISSAGMHHPAGDIKKIWFTYDAAVSNSSPIP